MGRRRAHRAFTWIGSDGPGQQGPVLRRAPLALSRRAVRSTVTSVLQVLNLTSSVSCWPDQDWMLCRVVFSFGSHSFCFSASTESTPTPWPPPPTTRRLRCSLVLLVSVSASLTTTGPQGLPLPRRRAPEAAALVLEPLPRHLRSPAADLHCPEHHLGQQPRRRSVCLPACLHGHSSSTHSLRFGCQPASPLLFSLEASSHLRLPTHTNTLITRSLSFPFSCPLLRSASPPLHTNDDFGRGHGAVPSAHPASVTLFCFFPFASSLSLVFCLRQPLAAQRALPPRLLSVCETRPRGGTYLPGTWVLRRAYRGSVEPQTTPKLRFRRLLHHHKHHRPRPTPRLASSRADTSPSPLRHRTAPHRFLHRRHRLPLSRRIALPCALLACARPPPSPPKPAIHHPARPKGAQTTTTANAVHLPCARSIARCRILASRHG